MFSQTTFDVTNQYKKFDVGKQPATIGSTFNLLKQLNVAEMKKE